MKNELPNYNKKVGGYVVFNKDGKTAITNDGTKGGYFYGDSHQDPSNGISAIVDNDRPILVEGNEVIINKKTVQSEKVLTVKGTPKEILSTLNQMDGNGVAIGDEEAEILAKYRTGGKISKEKHKLYLGEEGGMGVSPKGMFESAVQMENEGIDSETIRSITGWFRSDLDGLWRFEISDNEMEIICTFTDKEINHLKTKNNYIQRHLKDVIKHEELFKAYPRIKYLKVLFVDSNNSDVALLDVSNEGVMFIICNLKYEREISDNRGGTKELGEREISDNRRSGEERKAKRYNTLHFRKVITHELQHAIQINEGLAEGGNPNIELKKIKTDSGAIQSLTEKEQEYIATQRYLNKAGEIEAMSSDVRINLDDLQRIRNKPYSEIAIDPKYFSSDLETKIKFRTGGSVPTDINKLSLNEFEKYLEEKYNSKVELGDYKKYIYLSRIEVDKETRGLGIGSEIMSEIIDYADYNDKKITLTPSTDYGASSVARLKDFYKKFGFVENKGRNKDFEISQLMYRVPNKANKYHLGGDMSKHLAPNGKPSRLTHEQWHLVRKPEFLEFFGDWINSPETASKVVDENGEPLVCYHGTKNKNINTFNNVNYNEIYEYDAYGIYSSESIENAKHYSGDTGNVISIFVDIKNPYNLGTRETDKGRPTDKNLRAIAKERYEFYIEKGYDGVIFTDLRGIMFEIVALKPNQIKLADGTNTTFDANNDDIRFAEGGSISRMTPSELKAFYNTPEGKKLDAQTYSEWKRLVNMTKSELEKFYNSVEGKEAGLTTSQAKEQGIDSGRESARWVLKMKDIPYKEWSSDMWRWAKKQINFIKRMSGMKGSLYNDKGEKTRKHTALLIWGHNPEQKFKGGGDVKGYDNFKNPILINGFISNKKIDGKEIFLITYNSGGQEGLNVHQTMNPLAMLDAVEKKTGLHTNTLQVFIYEHTENSNRIETEDELEFLKDNYTVIIVDRDSVEFYNGHNPEQKFAEGGGVPKDAFTKSENERNEDYEANWNLWIDTLLKNIDLPIEWTTSESRKELYGDSFYITIFNEDWQEFAKLRFSGHSVMNTSRLQNEFHNPKISRFYEIVSRAMNKGQQDKHPEKLVRFKGGGELSKKALAVETNDLTDFVRKYFIKDGRIDVSDAMQELFGNKRGKSIADEYRKRIGLHKKGGLTISQLAHNLWEQHKDEVREGIDDSDFRNAVEEVLISEYGVSSMIKSLMEKSEGNEQDRENEYWMNQFDEGDDEYYEDLSDEEVADYFKDMEGFERELEKGTEHEMEHLDTLKKVAEGKLTPEQAVVQTASKHLEENPRYYEDLAKMEAENKVSNLDNLMSIMDSKVKYQGYSLKELYDEVFHYQGSRDGALIFSEFIKRKKDEGDTKIMDEFNRTSFVENINPVIEQEESIEDLIEGLKVLADSLEGAEKKEIEDVIEGLEILLESDNKFEKGGSVDNNSMIFEPSKADQDEEKRIMENQFGKNI